MTSAMLINTSFLIIGTIIGLIFYIDYWDKDAGKIHPTKSLKVQSLLIFLSSSFISGITSHYGSNFPDYNNQALIYYLVGLAASIVIFVFIFPLLISIAESLYNYQKSPFSKTNMVSTFLIRFLKSIPMGLSSSIEEIEKDQLKKLKSEIQNKENNINDCYGLLDGVLTHLFSIADEKEKRTEYSFKLLLDKYLSLILTTLFEETGKVKKYRAAIYYLEDEDSHELTYFTGISRDLLHKFSEKPLPLNNTIGGKSTTSNEVLIYPDIKRPFHKRSSKYKSFICVPISIDDEVEGILTIDCLDNLNKFNDPTIKEFLTVLSTVLYLAGTIYRVD